MRRRTLGGLDCQEQIEKMHRLHKRIVNAEIKLYEKQSWPKNMTWQEAVNKIRALKAKYDEANAKYEKSCGR